MIKSVNRFGRIISQGDDANFTADSVDIPWIYISIDMNLTFEI